jgi:tRNA threonylcarbamoyladenosine biosynthesis protein TsaB
LVELAARSGDAQVSQSSSLLGDISSVLKEAGVGLPEVDLFACALGPGSFTGLRIGIATLKALAASLERPCAGVPTLEAVALAAGPAEATVSLLPAGRGELFAQLFSVMPGGTVTALDDAAHLSPQKLVEKYAGFPRLQWAGNGAHRHRELIERYATQHGIAIVAGEHDANEASAADCWRLAPLEHNLARPVARLALDAFESGKLQSPQALKAIYVRPSDAELNQQCR